MQTTFFPETLTLESEAPKSIRLILNHKSLKNKEFSALTGISEQNLSGILHGRRNVGYEIAMRIAKAFGITPEAVLTGEGLKEQLEAAEQKGLVAQDAPAEYHIIERPDPGKLVEVDYLTIKGYASFLGGIEGVQIREFIQRTRFYNTEDLRITDKSLLVQVAGDSMYPTIGEGSKIMCEELGSDEWPYANGVVAVALPGDFLIKRVLSNRLKTSGTLLLGSDNPTRGELEVVRDDIQRMWKVVATVFQKVS